MKEYTIVDDLFDAIENCASIEWLIKEIKKHQEEMTKEQIMRVLNYYMSFKK